MKVLHIVVFIIFSGCSKSSVQKDISEKQEIPPAVEEPTDEQPLPTHEEVMAMLDSAVRSSAEKNAFGNLSPQILTPAGITTAIGAAKANEGLILTDDNEPGSANPNCGNNGSPFNENGQPLAFEDPEFALKKFYCLLHDNESSGTVRGMIAKIRQHNWTAQAYSDDWTHILNSVGLSDPGIDQVYLSIKKGSVAFRAEDFSASLDLQTGILRIEHADDTTGHHSRFMITGTIGADGQFNDLSDFFAVHSDGTAGRIITASGDGSSYIYNQLTYHDILEHWNLRTSACIGLSPCPTDKGIQPEGGYENGFTKTAGSQKVAEWKTTHAPLCFTSKEASVLPVASCELSQ